MTMITPSYLGETIEYSSLHACRSTLEDPMTKERFLDLVALQQFSISARESTKSGALPNLTVLKRRSLTIFLFATSMASASDWIT